LSSLCIISTERIWEREVSELPMHCFVPGLSIFMGTLEARDHEDSVRDVELPPAYEGEQFGGFLELLISKDLQTRQSSVLHCVTVSVIWEEARLLKVSPTSSWILLPPWTAATVPWNSSQAAWGSLN